MNNNIKIAILTFHRAFNYGAILQSYALMSVISKFRNVEVKLIDYESEKLRLQYINPKKISELPSLKRKIKRLIRWGVQYFSTKKESEKYFALETFVEHNLFLTNRLTVDKLENLNNTVDVFIVGSDQVWSARLTNYDESYFLNFVADGKKKISYAASLKIVDDKRTEDLINKYLPSFDCISVREQSAVEYLKNKFNINSCCALDPTFLLDCTAWMDLIQGKYEKQDVKYIVIYMVGQQEQLLENAFKYAKEYKLKVISLNHLKWRWRYYRDYSNSSIEQFIGLIRNAECVFTTSFHGLAIAINLHTKFYFETPQSSTNNNERLLDITRKLGLENRNIANGISEDKINWDSVEDKLNVLRKESMDFLYNSIGLNEDEQKDN